MPKHLALYFGYASGGGHFLQGGVRHGNHLDAQRACPGIPWSCELMDGRLLENGRHPDRPDGRVFWTCGRDKDGETLWRAFYWWDRSGDSRGASNSGFYVRGFEIDQWEEAFQFACERWPKVVKRQVHKLTLVPRPEEK